MEQAEEVIKPIRQELPTPILDWMRDHAFPGSTCLFDPLIHYFPGVHLNRSLAYRISPKL